MSRLPIWIAFQSGSPSYLGRLPIWVAFQSVLPPYMCGSHCVWVTLYGSYCVGHIVCITFFVSHVSHCAYLLNMTFYERWRLQNCDKYCNAHGCATRKKGFISAYVDFLSRGLREEYGSKGITVQTICPSYVCTSMTSFSRSLRKPSLMVPSAEKFVASAIQSIGFSDYTTGFWTHSLQSLLPFPYMPSLILKMNQRFRKEALSGR